jgi:hypothetical protein
MRSAVSSCAVSSHMYVVTGSSVLSLDESMYLQREHVNKPRDVNTTLQLHLWAGFFASMTRENACTMMLHSAAKCETPLRAKRATLHALHSLENLRGRVARERCLKLCAMCRRSCSHQENEAAPP